MNSVKWIPKGVFDWEYSSQRTGVRRKRRHSPCSGQLLAALCPVSAVGRLYRLHLWHRSLYIAATPSPVLCPMSCEPADKPGSVVGNHSSGMYVTAHLMRPTRKRRGQRQCFPIWSCSRWGLPCHGVLPPARCALTAPFHPYLIIRK